MSKKLLLTLSLLSVFSSNAQKWEWAKNVTHGAQAIGTSIGTDQNGNVYVIGSTHLTVGGGGGYFYKLFWKFDDIGNMLWADTLGIGGKSITNANGYTYVASGMIAKYDSSGQQLWIIDPAPAGFTVRNIALYPSGGIVVVGNVLIGNDTESVLARYDENGNCLWTRIGDFPAGGSIPHAITCDSYGNTYWVGQKLINDTTYGFLVKVDSIGNIISNFTIPNHPTDVAVSSDSSVYMLGYFSNVPIVINNDTFQFNNKTLYFIKYNQAGEVLWYKIIAGNSSIDGTALAAGNDNSIYLTGNYKSLNVDSFSLNSSDAEIFVMKIDGSGNILWVLNTISDNSPGSGYINDINLNYNDEIFLAGAFNGNSMFGSYTLTQNSDFTDLLIAKISQPTPISPAPEPHFPKIKEEEGLLVVPNPSKNNFSFEVFPNPAGKAFTLNFSSSLKAELFIRVKNEFGQLIYSETKNNFQGEYINTINLSKQPTGIYFVEVVCGEERVTRKIVIEK